jgi:hypothetical protein
MFGPAAGAATPGAEQQPSSGIKTSPAKKQPAHPAAASTASAGSSRTGKVAFAPDTKASTTTTTITTTTTTAAKAPPQVQPAGAQARTVRAVDVLDCW